MTATRISTLISSCLAFAVAASTTLAESPRVPDENFLKQHCFDCHQGSDAEAGLDLTTLGNDLSKSAVENHWVRIIDRVRDGEMPPADSDRTPGKATESFLGSATQWLRDYQHQRDEKFGRVRSRRLTRREVERSLHDLLGIDIPLQHLLPEDTRTAGFTTVASGQAMSHFQLEQHLNVVDAALDEAFSRATTPDKPYERDFDAKAVARANPKRRCREPEMRNGQAVVWSGGVTFYGRLPVTTAPTDGWYHFEVTISALKQPETGGVWSTVNSGLCVSSAPILTPVTVVEATAQPQTIEFTAWLPKGHMLEIRPGDVTLKKARFEGGQIGTGEGEPQNVPGIAIDRVTMKQTHRGASNNGIQNLLFGDLEVQFAEREQFARVVSKNPKADIKRLMNVFAQRAFRRPVSEQQIDGYVKLAMDVQSQKLGLKAALRTGYRALLCSPRFLYLTEEPGRLDDHAIAARLSYFLTGSTPDASLTKLANAGRLREPAVIKGEADRLLDSKNGRLFIDDFSAEWLDLDQINFTEPDRRIYRDFDSIVQSSMLDETRTYLQTMLTENLDVGHLINSNFTYLNSRLARYYGIDGVDGGDLRRVSLAPEHHRGGVLTQGAILKVTANGSTTSPVVRGVWVSERLLGVPIPPPPGNVPAIEPDIRGAKTIREQLAKHRSQQSCAVCHVKIDPPGFALENFDPAGKWRNRYFQQGQKNQKNAPLIDASYSMPDGREFTAITDFQTLITTNQHPLATCLAEKLLTYGTGASISFSDREAIEQIVDACASDNYGIRSIVHSVVTSPIFLSK
jgi:hypothetical protein